MNNPGKYSSLENPAHAAPATDPNIKPASGISPAGGRVQIFGPTGRPVGELDPLVAQMCAAQLTAGGCSMIQPLKDAAPNMFQGLQPKM